jgi:tetratricopeptide (TPR) repeat protein
MQRKLIIAPFLALALTLAGLPVHADSAKKAAKDTSGLSAEFVYKYLVGEIAGQRGDLGLASTLLLDLAKSSRDPRLAERATRAALYGNQPQIALRAAYLWAELDPDSKDAHQALTQLLMASGQLAELRPHLQKLIAEEDDRAGAFMYLVGMFSQSSDKAGVLKLVQELAKPYPDLPEAHFALAHAAWSAGQEKLAISELQAADQANPGWEPGALLKGQILQRKASAEALQFYQEFLNTYPNSNEVRLAYARLLVNEKQLESAKQQFDMLVEAAPGNAEIHVVVGLLSVQMEDFANAKTHFMKALELNFKEPDQIKIYLGQIAERLKNDAEAQEWYGKVGTDSPHYLDAQLRSAILIAKQGRLDEARKRIQALPDLTGEQRVLANQTEANLLVQAKRPQEAFDLLRETVETMPNSPDLIYDYAMVAERVQRFDVMEHELNKLIVLKPEMGHAYNALGYSLADRNERLDEAQTLIEKALSLNPSDYFILDSMGWLKYRRGQLGQALDYLKRAYAVQPDPEIAAHLGEVLWQQGNREEAIKTWENALHEHPDNEVLLNTSKKFQK